MRRFFAWLDERRSRRGLIVLGSGAVLLALSGPFVWAGYHQYTGLAALTNYHSAEAREHLEACLRVWPWSRSSRLHLLAARAARREGNFDSAREKPPRCPRLSHRRDREAPCSNDV